MDVQPCARLGKCNGLGFQQVVACGLVLVGQQARRCRRATAQDAKRAVWDLQHGAATVVELPIAEKHEVVRKPVQECCGLLPRGDVGRFGKGRFGNRQLVAHRRKICNGGCNVFECLTQARDKLSDLVVGQRVGLGIHQDNIAG